MFGAAVLAGCSAVVPQSSVRGNRVDLDRLKELVPGTSTRNDATALLGSPTARATFDDNTWIYIGEVTRPRVGQTPGVLSQQVVTLAFDEGGVLRDEKVLTQKDAQSVDVVSRTTPSPGSNASFLQQVLGNVGRFNPLGTGNSNAGSSGNGFSMGGQ